MGDVLRCMGERQHSILRSKSRNIRRVDPAPIPLVRSFDGGSGQLARTQIIPTLDTPAEKGKNILWCASFQLAWKRLQDDVVKQPIRLTTAEPTTIRLNQALDPLADLPADACYATAGAVREGVIQRIETEMNRRFPSQTPPRFGAVAPDGQVASAFLQTQSRFSIPFFQSRSPLRFTDGGGAQTLHRSFGIRTEDEYAYDELRRQVLILHRARDDNYRITEFVIDLSRNSQPNQVVMARVPLEGSLLKTLAAVEQRIDRWKPEYVHEAELDVRDTLLVPDMFFRIEHRFDELEGAGFLNSSVSGQRLEYAGQQIVFRLDRSGAELWTEAKFHCRPTPAHFDLDRPFLLYMKKRDAKQPFFVMWVDNAELLQPWMVGG